jgi:hypothetical protein
MLGIMIVAGVIAWIVLILWLAVIALEDKPHLNIVAFVVFVVPVGILVNQAIKHERENPCVEWERKMQYNPATKTIMPMRVCVLRGEWVD